MGNLHLVTGYSGTPHVASSDQGSLFEALIRNGQFVMDAGAKFAATIVSNNQIRVSDGELMMQGRHVKLTPGAYVDLAIANGAQGYLRKDLIVARYTRNSDNGIEECSLVVLKGTQAESNPSDPEYITGNLNADGALQHDFPLYRVPISGLNIGELEALFKPEKSIFDSVLRLAGGTMTGNIAMSGYKVTGLGTPTANGDAVSLVYANQKFAPAGYGLGETNGKYVSDCYAIDKAGFYRADGVTANKPGGFENCVIQANITDGDVYLTATYAEMTAKCYYSSYAKAWQPWEYENPPMFPGVEYRTTERYHNVPVYKKVNSNGDILWRKDGESQWHLLTSASYVAAATVE